jgi:hypothetical protein
LVIDLYGINTLLTRILVKRQLGRAIFEQHPADSMPPSMNVKISVIKSSLSKQAEIHQHLVSLSIDVKELQDDFLFRIAAGRLFEFVYFLKENSIPFHAEFYNDRA